MICSDAIGVQPRPSILEDQKSKHRQMYLEIRMLSLVNECLLFTPHKKEVEVQKNLLDRIVVFYKKCDHYLNFATRDSNLRSCDEALTKYLKLIFSARTASLVFLTNFLSTISSEALRLIFKSVAEDFEKMHEEVQEHGNVSDQTVTAWEKMTQLFLIKFSIECETRNLHSYCGKLFSSVIRKAEIWTLYLAWLQFLQKESRSIPTEDSIRTALKIKNLLNTAKEAFFIEFLAKEGNVLLALRACQEWKASKVKPEIILNLLKEGKMEAKKNIRVAEEELISRMGNFTHCASTIIRFITTSSYFKTADFLVESQEKLVKSNPARFGSFLAAPLSAPYMSLSKSLATLGLMACEFAQWNVFGISQAMLSTIVNQIKPTIDCWIALFQYVHLDEQSVVTCLPTIYRLLEFTTFIGINGYTRGYHLNSIAQMSFSYFIALGASHGCGKVVDVFYLHAYKGQPLQEIPSYPLVRGITQWVVFPIISGRILPIVIDRFQTFYYSPSSFLSDENYCLANAEHCKKEACDALGLAENADFKKVKQAFRGFSLQYHPDKQQADNERFFTIKNAYELYCKIEKKQKNA